MQRIFYIFTLIVGMILPLNAQAESQCYSKLQAEAEQGLRIHSELMVIGLNCQHMAKRYNMDLYGRYRQITQRHSDLFALYEKEMMKFFISRGDQNPEASLNTLRTSFANKISHDAAEMRPDIFCGTFAPRMNKVYDMSEPDLRGWASTIYDTHPVSYPVCGG